MKRDGNEVLGMIGLGLIIALWVVILLAIFFDLDVLLD